MAVTFVIQSLIILFQKKIASLSMSKLLQSNANYVSIKVRFSFYHWYEPTPFHLRRLKMFFAVLTSRLERKAKSILRNEIHRNFLIFLVLLWKNKSNIANRYSSIKVIHNKTTRAYMYVLPAWHLILRFTCSSSVVEWAAKPGNSIKQRASQSKQDFYEVLPFLFWSLYVYERLNYFVVSNFPSAASGKKDRNWKTKKTCKTEKFFFHFRLLSPTDS